MRCGECGSDLRLGAKFCSECGAVIDGPSNDEGKNIGASSGHMSGSISTMLSDEERVRLRRKHKKQTRVMLALGALFFVAVLVKGLLDSHSERQAAVAAAEEQARVEERNRQARAERQERLQESFSDADAAVKEGFAAFDAAADGNDFENAERLLSDVGEVLRPYIRMDDPPDGVSELNEGFKSREAIIETFLTLKKAQVARDGEQWIDAEELYSDALEGIGPIAGTKIAPTGVRRLRRDAEKGKRSVASEAKKERDERERVAVLMATCGDRPRRSQWDGEIIGIESAVKRTAHDPGSIDIENCTPAVLTDACWKTTCQVRGKNAFGASVLNVVTFYVATENGVATVLATE